MIVLYIVILIYFNFNITSIVNVFMLSIEKKNFIKKETLAQMFSCEFCEIFKNIHFIDHLKTTASSNLKALTLSIQHSKYIQK